tara:strand:- start:4987 stop:5187 length:201 start_codon:yes stop_codon:yes gene_type:complete
MSFTKILTAITATITAMGGLIVAINTMFGDEEVVPQPVTHIIIQEVGDYADFLESTDLEEYNNLKQ